MPLNIVYIEPNFKSNEVLDSPFKVHSGELRCQPPDPSISTWFTSIKVSTIQANRKRVTHLGDLGTAAFRADVEASFESAEEFALYGVQLERGLKVHDRALIEPSECGNPIMEEFEKELLSSDADLAFYWNQKEAEGAQNKTIHSVEAQDRDSYAGGGSWSIVIKRNVLGKLPEDLNNCEVVSRRTSLAIKATGIHPYKEVVWDRPL